MSGNRAGQVGAHAPVVIVRPTADEARAEGFRWDDAADTAWLDVGPWTARITVFGAWVNVSIDRPPHEVLDRAVPGFDAFAAAGLRASLAQGLDPGFVADGPLVLALGILRDAPDGEDRVADRVAGVRRMLEQALTRAARHPDPRVGRCLMGARGA